MSVSGSINPSIMYGQSTIRMELQHRMFIWCETSWIHRHPQFWKQAHAYGSVFFLVFCESFIPQWVLQDCFAACSFFKAFKLSFSSKTYFVPSSPSSQDLCVEGIAQERNRVAVTNHFNLQMQITSNSPLYFLYLDISRRHHHSLLVHTHTHSVEMQTGTDAYGHQTSSHYCEHRHFV